MITNEQGQIALVFGQNVQKLVEVNGHQYVFVVKSNICLAWVNAPDVASILAILGRGCCGHRAVPQFAYASASQVQVWTTGHY